MDSLQIDTNMTFCPINLVVNQPLSIVNTSQNQLAFKIKTNQKNLLSMYINHGFIKPFSTVSIPVKIVQKVDDSTSIKLQVNWCIATQQIKKQNDSKMSSVAKDKIFKKIFPINRKVQNLGYQSQNTNKSTVSQQKNSSVFDSVYSSGSVQRQQKKITPFEYEKQTKVQPIIVKQVINTPKKSDLNLQLDQQQEQRVYIQQKDDAVNAAVTGSTAKNLQTVSQQDEDDHEKQLEQIRNLQIQQKRKIDEIKVKIRKVNQTIKSKQIINPKILAIGIATSFLFGGFIQYLIF